VKPAYLSPEAIREFIASALREDLGAGDHSSLAAVPRERACRAELLIKDSGTIAGLELAGMIFTQVDPGLKIVFYLNDGDRCHKGEKAFEVTGNARSILSAERLVLNCLQRMSGIATRTRQINSLLEGTKAKLLDTRKTTPNFRIAEKWAVLIGGGTNHRFGLFDQILLKDNHIDLAGGVQPALDRARHYVKHAGLPLKIEIEARTLQEVEGILASGGADIILLDNMDTGTLRTAVALIGGRAYSEASGGITEENLREVAETGVDYISIGALTHSVNSLDMSLKITKPS
jgi:nicotinate-nucleotide pyrophosphorylase (carboxylating)